MEILTPDRLNHIRRRLWLRYKTFFKSQPDGVGALAKFTEFVQPVCSTIWQLCCRESRSRSVRSGRLSAMSCGVCSGFWDSKGQINDFLALVLPEACFVQLSWTVPRDGRCGSRSSLRPDRIPAAPHVYAIGLDQERFPRKSRNEAAHENEKPHSAKA